MSVLPEKKEAALIARTDAAFGSPVTREILTADLRSLGLQAGDIVLLHSSLSSLGWVLGHAETVIASLEDIIGEQGTLVMPAHSGHLSDPSSWEHPPVPEAWIPVIRKGMPAFDTRATTTRGMGAIPELFRTLPGVRRSHHPTCSFVARGSQAARITGGQVLEEGLGKESPLERIYELNGRILLLGVGHGNNTSLHLAEHRADWPGRRYHQESSPLMIDGRRSWKEYTELDFDDIDFVACGAAFEKCDKETLSIGQVGLAECRLISQRRMVDFAVEWFSSHRLPGGESDAVEGAV